VAEFLEQHARKYLKEYLKPALKVYLKKVVDGYEVTVRLMPFMLSSSLHP
jgi:hypothetical protein